jgi:hypothetical protein
MYGAALFVGAFIVQAANVAYAQPAKLDMVWQSLAVAGANPAGPPAMCAKGVEAFLKSKGFTTVVSKSSEDKDPKYVTGSSDTVAVFVECNVTHLLVAAAGRDSKFADTLIDEMAKSVERSSAK